MNKPIILKQVLDFGTFDFKFKAVPNIKLKQLLKFYKDISLKLREIDSEINYEGDTYKFNRELSLSGIVSPRYSRIEKSLQVRKGNPDEFNLVDVVRTHNIVYQKDPLKLSGDLKEIIKNNQYKDVLMFIPNLTISSTDPVYSSEGMIEFFKKLPYVEISDEFQGVFDYVEIMGSKKIALKYFEQDLTSLELNRN